MELVDGTAESAATYALCYKCHSRTVILSNNTFTRHSLHIVGLRASCLTCHDPHGVNGGTAANNGHLVNFNTNVVSPAGTVLRYDDTGVNHGSCTLTCHGVRHDAWNY